MSTSLLTKHPCFSKEASQFYGRIHLPVAKKCNISCNYCNRKYDCNNESRPGVTSKVLSPEEALDHLTEIVTRRPYLTTMGIAGPGDSLANPDKTFKTLELVKNKYPDMHLCISTNGLMLPEYADELVNLGVKYITVTINSTDPKVAEKIYRRVRYKGVTYKGTEAAEVLIEQQVKGVEKLADKEVFLKINTLYIDGIKELPELVELSKVTNTNGAHLFNVMPLIPAPGSVFEGMSTPKEEDIKHAQEVLGIDTNLMTHCQQCRSDAVGLLSEDESCGSNADACGPKTGNGEAKAAFDAQFVDNLSYQAAS